MKLNDAERQSAVWTKISEELTARLESLRTQNDTHKTAEETASLRGRIAEVKSMLNWAIPDPIISGD